MPARVRASRRAAGGSGRGTCRSLSGSGVARGLRAMHCTEVQTAAPVAEVIWGIPRQSTLNLSVGRIGGMIPRDAEPPDDAPERGPPPLALRRRLRDGARVDA